MTVGAHGSTSQMTVTFDQEEYRSHIRGNGGGGAAHTRSQHPGLGSTTGQCPGRGPSAAAHSAGGKQLELSHRAALTALS